LPIGIDLGELGFVSFGEEEKLTLNFGEGGFISFIFAFTIFDLVGGRTGEALKFFRGSGGGDELPEAVFEFGGGGV
jgi:hypothetical protein